MSALSAADGTPVGVGDPGSADPVYATGDILDAVQDVRTLALYDLLKARLCRSVVVANPAAGANFSATVPPGVAWEVISVELRLTTSAVVANRQTNLVFTDPTGLELGRLYYGAAVAASTVATITYMQGIGTSQGGSIGFQSLPSPSLPLLAGGTVATSISGIDTGDQLSNIALYVREWSVGQVYWAADLIGRELGFETLTDLPTSTAVPVANGQPIPVSPIVR